MSDRYTFYIKEQIDSKYAISVDKADTVYRLLDKAVANNESINVSFSGIEILITAFLNNAIGPLYEKYSVEQIDSCLNFIDMNEQFQKTLDAVKSNAISKYKK